jgi:hypothetical protein
MTEAVVIWALLVFAALRISGWVIANAYHERKDCEVDAPPLDIPGFDLDPITAEIQQITRDYYAQPVPDHEVAEALHTPRTGEDHL